MAFKAKKTEHAGPKKGSGAYWGRKIDAKRESNRKRRERRRLSCAAGREATKPRSRFDSCRSDSENVPGVFPNTSPVSRPSVLKR